MQDRGYIGPFEVALDELLGSGGMANVWRGRHREEGVPVAVKVVEGARSLDRNEAFDREVRTTAELSHPSIVEIYDYGQLDDVESRGFEGVVPDDAPYMVTELAEGGALEDELGVVDDWSTLEGLLFEILDALAYSHARDLIHRDLKPGNVLLVPDGDEIHFKLTDFGIAHAFDPDVTPDEDLVDAAAGTPHYMPPEQLDGRWRDHGPWTDLYALGIMAYQLASGDLPFTGERLTAVVGAQLTQAPPPLEPQFPVPEGFGAWVNRCLAKRPMYRYRRAADAAHYLGRLEFESEAETVQGDRSTGREGAATPVSRSFSTTLHEQRPETADREVAPTTRENPGDEETTEAPGQTEKVESESTSEQVEEGTRSQEVGFAETLAPERLEEDDNPSTREGVPDPDEGRFARAPAVPPHVPRSWRVDRDRGETQNALGGGTKLFGLRETPFVDRDDERTLAWNELREAARDGEPRCVLLEGSSGEGKSRIATWILRRIHEVGAGSILRAPHSAHGGPASGFSRMLERYFVVWGMERGAAYRRIQKKLEDLTKRGGLEVDRQLLEEEARALTELIEPTSHVGATSESGGPTFRFSSARERYLTVSRLLQLIAASRPVGLFLDDLQWADDALGLLEQLFDRSTPSIRDGPLPLFVLGTVRREAAESRDRVASQLEALRESDRVSTVEVGPLDSEHHRELIHHTLRLAPDLTRRIADRTDGNPLFAIQLVEDWIDRGLIEFDGEWFQLAEDVEVELPDDIHSVWKQRIEHFLSRFEAGTEERRLALELAAALGNTFRDDEWRRLCREAGLPVDRELIDNLLRSGFWEEHDENWSFVEGLMRESIARSARQAGRWRDHHRRCADVLEDLYDADAADVSERRAMHLIEAEQYERALDPLESAIRDALHSGNFEKGRDLIEWRRDVTETLELGEDDPRRLANLYFGASLDRYTGRAERAFDRIERAAEVAEANDYGDLLGQLRNVEADLLRVEGRLEDARECANEAREHLDAAGHDEELAVTARELGGIHYSLGNLEEAQSRLEEAYDRYRELGDDVMQVQPLGRLGQIRVAIGEHDEAAAAFERARLMAEREGARVVEANLLNSLGELAREREKLEPARDYYREAARKWRLSGHRDQYVARLNLALGDLRSGYYPNARTNLETLESSLREFGLKWVLPGLHLGLARAAAWESDWASCRERSREAMELLEGREMTDRDLAWLAETTGRVALEADRGEWPVELLQFAREQWEELGSDEGIERVEETLEEAKVRRE